MEETHAPIIISDNSHNVRVPILMSVTLAGERLRSLPFRKRSCSFVGWRNNVSRDFGSCLYFLSAIACNKELMSANSDAFVATCSS